MQHYWFGDVEDNRCTPAPDDLKARCERLQGLKVDIEQFIVPSWEQAVSCGIVADRAEYIRQLREVCIAAAQEKIASYYRQSDIELLQMVRMLDEMDTVINLLTGRAGEWYQVKNPRFTRKQRAVTARKMLEIIRRADSAPLRRIGSEIENLAAERTRLMREVSARAEEVAPNCSALVGGLVAARLVSRAGGLKELSRMPASTIQVLGAENALFTHLRAGTPPPKHGIIFQHRRVHNAPKECRGRVARVLAAKLGIAARIDYYRGAADPGFLKQAQARIDAAGEMA